MTKKFKNLDSIRTVAFLTTFMGHNFVSASPEVSSSYTFAFIHWFKSIFSFGVPLFFVLSGFLISYLMLVEFEEKKYFNIVNFYIRRILRIWPPYYLVIFIGFVVFPIVRQMILHEGNIENANPLMYLAFLSNFDQINLGMLPIGIGLGVTWSVSVEEQFYLFWPLIFLLFQGRKFLYGILISLALAIICSIYFNLPAKHTLFCIIYLSTGALLAYIHYYYATFSSNITAIRSWSFLSIVMGCLLLMKYGSSVPVPNAILQFILAIIMAYILLFQVQCRDSMDLKNIPYLEYLGKFTYGLYLYHTICNFIAYSLVRLFHLYDYCGYYAIDAIFRPLSSLVFSLVISYLSYQYYEKYFLKLKSKFH